MNESILDDAEIARYRTEGYLVVRGLFDSEELLPTLIGIDRLLCAKGGLRVSAASTVVEDIHEKILDIARTDRATLGIVYDGMRKLLAFWALVANKRLSTVVRQLLDTECVGVAFRGCGIRMDLPNEEEWRSIWHQEYHAQMSSINGIVASFGLVPVTAEMGPLEIAPKSHRDGLLPVRCVDPMNEGGNYTGMFEIPAIEESVQKYGVTSFETTIGDVILLDFLTLHQSGFNRSVNQSRITCQVRYFDMNNQMAVDNDWAGGWRDGKDFTQVHPDMVLT